ncbi:beta-lactamase family protein [Pontibacter sp. HSC-14F20]|uniref:serine hydrolase domain-containing protein n=1 Tax=Pontibacter sp. HSC-14F20 TaxID=2864136 RepID=UPI001C73BB8D|nr:serine hydrolase [Pontibacter sp. HSC-14F20]MBX0333289.1 beta-lactamase family protein [Pontibacter sp. HSC-14F20]
MIKSKILYLALALGFSSCQQQPQQPTVTAQATEGKLYYPGKGDNWEKKQPEQQGMDAALLQEAVEWARQQETTQMSKDFSTQEEIFGKMLGPIPEDRASTNGIILRNGFIVAEWGETERVDPTYSVAKSVLSTILGITIDRGMIKDIHDPVANYVQDGGYDSEQNRKVTWEHHVRQTSEWEGELWGKKHDFVGKAEFGRGERKPRALQEPGTHYEYNDVRINRFALSLLRLWKKPIPEVFKDEVMDPIDASNTWQYVPYRNSYVELDGKRAPSVSGGTRWGGGLWISARDEARFGYLFLRNGRWKDKQLVSQEWVKEATTSRGSVGPDYGYLWWLNTGGKAWPSAPTSSYAALGAGQNTIWVDPEHDIVMVWRWHKGNPDELIKRVLAAVKE